MRRPRLRHDTRLFALALAAGLPAVAFALWFLWAEPHAAKVTWTGSVVVVAAWLGFAFAVKEATEGPLQTLANLLAGLREGDYSIRGRMGRADDALGAAVAEVNALGDRLRALRIGALEATALLDKVLAEVDVAIFVFDDAARLTLANRAGERLVGDARAAADRRGAAELGLGAVLDGEAPRVVEGPLAGARGQWELRRSLLRLDGKPHTLVVLTDVARALRDEEKQAWQRMVRVLGHEINNSLAPIQSIAGSLRAGAARADRAADFDDDLRRGLDVIERRAESLGRFMQAYATLTRLPPPRLGDVGVAAWVGRVAALEQRLPVRLVDGADVTLRADGDQLDQLLINLVRNAVDAALETGGAVEVAWTRVRDRLELRVRDDGPGLAATANLFVPFFTTKPGGAGIGLALSRQIAEAHGGTLHLFNRQDARGCEAFLTLPVH